jgi:hypothetical protein
MMRSGMASSRSAVVHIAQFLMSDAVALTFAAEDLPMVGLANRVRQEAVRRLEQPILYTPRFRGATAHRPTLSVLKSCEQLDPYLRHRPPTHAVRRATSDRSPHVRYHYP